MCFLIGKNKEIPHHRIPLSQYKQELSFKILGLKIEIFNI